MKISDVYLKFLDETNDTTKLVSVSDILHSGHPIDEESGDDLKLVSDSVYDNNGIDLAEISCWELRELRDAANQ